MAGLRAGLAPQRSQAIVIFIGVLLLLALSYTAVFLGAEIALGLCGIVVVITLVLVRVDPAIWVVLSIACVMFSSTSWDGDSSVPSVLLRLCAIGFIFCALAANPRSRVPNPFVVHSGFRSFSGILIPLGFYLVIAALAHGSWVEFIGYIVGLMLLAIGLIAVFRLPLESLYMGLLYAMLLFVGASLLAGGMIPDIAIAGGRLRGLTSNANLLGFYSFVLTALSILFRPGMLASRIALMLAMVTLFWSGSRASMLAFVVLLLCYFAYSKSLGPKFIGIVFLTVFAIVFFFGFSDSLLGKSLFDGTNSRLDSWLETVRVFDIAPWTGIGLSESVEVASSPLRATVHAGVWGALAVLAMWVALFVSGRRSGWRSSALAMSAVTHSCFEGWLLSPIGPIFMIFMLLWVLACRVGGESNSFSKPPRQQGSRVLGHTG
jgi:hypothetical protein